jgi:hypothetical protein
MVGAGVHMVNAKGIGAQRLHQGSISTALLGVDEWVGLFRKCQHAPLSPRSKLAGLTWCQLVGDALGKELDAFASEEFVAGCRNHVNGVCCGGA